MRAVMTSVLITAITFLIAGLNIPTKAMSADDNRMCVKLAMGKMLPVRAGPGLRFAVIGQLPAGDCSLKLTNFCEGNWCKVSAGQIAGWVHIGYLYPAK